MSSVNTSKNENSPFARALEQSFSDQMGISKGKIIDGKVLDIDSQGVFVSLNQKSDGRVPRSEFTELPEIGSTISVLIRGKEPDSEIYICSKNEADLRRGWEIIKDAYKNNLQVEGKITSEVKGKGYNVLIEGVELFLPASHVGHKVGSMDELKEKLISFKILKLADKGRTGVVSRKQLLEEINQEKWTDLIKAVNVGDKVKGKVSKITGFGVFININGVDGLLRQNDISYKKFASFKQYFKPDQEVEVVILSLDPENNKLSLGLKQLYEDPWDWAKRELEKDMVVRGVVTSLTNFGAFVELKEGLEGLIHTSELSWSKKPPHPKDLLKKGEEVESTILDIDFEKRRMSLGLKQLQPNPWFTLSSNVRTGNVLEGKITGITKYGAFVEVENGIEGLIHISDITWDEKVKDPASILKKGQMVNYKILDINIDGQRISCGLKQLQENPLDSLKKKYPVGTKIRGKIKSVTAFGVFIEIEPGYDGLVHISQIPDGKNMNLAEIYKTGDEMSAVILKVDVDTKKISLSIKELDKAVEREEMSKYIKSDSPSSGSLGSFINKQ